MDDREFHCPSCGEIVEEGEKFCSHCGEKLDWEEIKREICPNCGKPYEAGAKFCPNCGASLTEESPEKEEPEEISKISEESEEEPKKTIFGTAPVPVPFGEEEKEPDFPKEEAHEENNAYRDTSSPGDYRTYGEESLSDKLDHILEGWSPVNSDGFSDTSFRGRFFNFVGRLNRWRYFTWGILLTIIFFIVYSVIVVGLAGSLLAGEGLAFLLGCLLYLVFQLPFYLGALSLSIRRAHDMGKSTLFGFLYLLNLPLTPILKAADSHFLSFIVAAAFFVYGMCLLFVRGTQGPNKYGADPLGH